MNRIFNVKDASTLLQCSERYLSDEIRAKNITAYLVARKYLIFESDVIKYIQSHETNNSIYSEKGEPEKIGKKELSKNDNQKKNPKKGK